MTNSQETDSSEQVFYSSSITATSTRGHEVASLEMLLRKDADDFCCVLSYGYLLAFSWYMKAIPIPKCRHPMAP